MVHPMVRRLSSAAILLLAVFFCRFTDAHAQEPFRIQGVVLDALTQQPLSNVSVVLRGSGLGTLTNRDGRYILVARVPPGDYTLQYSVIGRREASAQVVLPAGAPAVQMETVLLEQSAVQLEEIVVTGTGAPTERRAIGNTVASIAGEIVNEAPAASTVDQALQGRVVGASISENSGQPGGGVSIRLRGTSSILGGAEPLIVVDGVIIDNNAEALQSLGANAGRAGGGAALSNRLADINPNDIERVEVIKGAAAAALYGSRANNGVIQIFTKRGSQGAPRISLSSNVEMNQTPDRYDLLMTPIATRADSAVFFRSRGIRPGDPIERFDVQDQIFRTGYGANNQLSIMGGAEGTSYYLSAGRVDDQGILESTGYERTSVLGKVTQQVTDWLELTVNGNLIQSEARYAPEGEQTAGVLTGLIFGPTSFNFAFDPNLGRFPFSPVLSFNPLDVIANWRAPEDVTRVLGSVETTLRPTSDLTVRYLFGLDDYRQTSAFFRPPGSERVADPGRISVPVLLSRQMNHDLTGNHEFQLNPSLGLTTTLGMRYTSDEQETIRAAAEGLAPGVTLIEGATQFASQSSTSLKTLGFFAQERITLNERLFVTAGVNLEAASAFGEEERWQTFPRIGVSWLAQDEPFFAGLPLSGIFSTLRLRAAYGQTGGQPPGNFLGANFYPGASYAGLPGFRPSTTIGNPDLRPEQQEEWEFGFEAGFLRDRAMLEFTYYDQKTTDLVLLAPVAPSLGAQQQYQNIGAVSNRGIEAAINTININRANLSWESRLTLATNENEVTQLLTGQDTLEIPGGGYPNAVIVGQPVGVFYGRGYVRDAEGAIVIDPATGVGRRTGNRFILGDPNPDLTASFSNTVTLGESWDFNFLLDGRFGQQVANFTRRISDFFGTGAELQAEIDALQQGQVLALSRNVFRISNYEEYVEDADYVKLREIGLRYSLSPGLARRIRAERASIRLAARNLYTWTEYSGLDPEVNLFSANTVARGVDFATTPVPRSYVLGIDLSF